MAKNLNDLSRAVSHALRHEPWLYELELDAEGWTNVIDLLAALRMDVANWRDLTEQDIADMIRSSSKQRHELVDGRIRALYGHSLPGRLRKALAEPPEVLFHGTAPASVPLVRRQGLRAMTRQYVHLSTDRDMAVSVGGRKAAAPVVLMVRARQASQEGVRFYAGNDKVWLADHVPAGYIEIDPALHPQ